MSRPLAHAAVLCAYLATSALLLGHGVLSDPTHAYVGLGNDAEIAMWSFDWWPHAIGHGLDPFLTHAIWAPSGVNLAWTTSMLGQSLLLAPVTLAFGPIASWNVAAIASPALSAFTAYLLCRAVGAHLAPALVGGYLFGFSSYMLGQSLGHLHVLVTFLVPLAALLVLRRLDGRIGVRGYAILLGVLIALQLSFSTELAATLSLAGVGAGALACVVVPQRRSALRALLRPTAAGYGIGLVLAGPLLWALVAHGIVRESINSPFVFSADSLNLVLPTQLTWLGGGQPHGVVDRFRGNLAENGAYLGLPLLAIVGLYARSAWRRPGGRFLVLAFAVSLVASLGPVLRIAGLPAAPLPWLAVVFVPPFNNILPVRLMLFTSLAAALIAALWLSQSRVPAWQRAGLAVLAIAFLLPDVGAPIWTTRPALPVFFQGGRARAALGPNRTIVVLPYANRGDSMLWQAESDMSFSQSGGYILPQPPAAFRDDPVVRALLAGPPGPSAASLRAFMHAHGATALVVSEADAPAWQPLLSGLGVPRRTAGVLIYRT